MKEAKIEPFQFKQFTIEQDKCLMKVGTDGVLLGAWADVSMATSILDIGTGTGLIAIMLAQRNATAQIHGVEIDEATCEQAKQNMKNAIWSTRLAAFPIAIQAFATTTSYTYDHIVSNPPFFTGGTFSDNQDRNSVRHTVKLPHGDLLGTVRKLLQTNGKFSIILPYLEGLRFEELATTYNLHCTRKLEVHPKADKPIERLLLQFERTAKTQIVEKLVIQKEGRNDWTDEYINLTKDFYLNLSD
jgi:tRNA1Val (adenine37-N6)-methyltransferase